MVALLSRHDLRDGHVAFKDGRFMPRSGERPAAGQVLRQTLTDLWAAQVMELAAALAFYGVLSLFPLVLAGAALASWVVPAAVVSKQLATFVESAVPPELVDVAPLVSNAIAARVQTGLFAVILWVLAGRRIFGALVTALDRVSDVDARQETIARRALVEVVALAGVGLLFAAAVIVRPVLALLWDTSVGAAAIFSVPWLIGAGVHALVLFAAFFALYSVVPHGERNYHAVAIGACVATCLALVLRVGVMALFGRFWSSYALMYGPMALAAILLTWSWVFGLILLFGGSLASHVKVMVFEGKNAEETEARHVAHKRTS
jgi:membrane protein